MPATARADNGFYAVESFGASAGHGALADMIGGALRVRIGIGMRLGRFALEPWVASDLQIERIGGFKGLVGGQPMRGSADLSAMGLDGKYLVALDRHISVFVRAGPLVADGNGALAGYHGRGVGFAGGAQLVGEVRALGFLWAPLFYVKRGPLVTGALLLDVGYDANWLRSATGPPINAGVTHVSMGFAIGSAF
jgi:hypothetical protein